MMTALSTMFTLAMERGWIDGQSCERDQARLQEPNPNREWLPQEWGGRHEAGSDAPARHLHDRPSCRIPQPIHRRRRVGELSAGPGLRQVLPDEPQQERRHHWLPASPELQAFLASLKVRTAKGKIAVCAATASPGRAPSSCRSSQATFLTGLAKKGLVRPRPDRARPARHLRRRDQACHRRQ